MQSVTPAFLTAVQTSHQVVVQLDILATNVWPVTTVATFSGTNTSGDLPSVTFDGSVRIDKTASYRRTCTLKVTDPTQSYLPRFDCIPSDEPSDYFCPFGRHIRLWRGVQYNNGTQELASLGIFRIVDVEIVDDPMSGGFVYTITGDDISRTVSRNKIDSTGATGIPNTVPYVVAAGTTFGQAIHDFILNAFPYAAFPTSASDGGFGAVILSVTDALGAGIFSTQPLIGGAAGIVPAVYSDGTDPWAEAVKMASLCGCQLYVDVNGIFRLVPEPTQPNNNAASVFAVSEGVNLRKVSRKLTDQVAYNKVVVSGEGVNLTGIAPSAMARDTNSKSPTWIGVLPNGTGTEGTGPYGKVTDFVSDSLVINTATAQAAANMQLFTALGSHEIITVDMLVNPALDINDIISVTRSRIALTGTLFYIDSMTIPLSAKNTMTATVRQVLPT